MSRAMSLDKTTGVWSVTINGDLLNKYYTYSVTHGKTTKETADVYAKACGVNGQRSMVVDLSTTNPDGWEMISMCLYRIRQMRRSGKSL